MLREHILTLARVHGVTVVEEPWRPPQGHPWKAWSVSSLYAWSEPTTFRIGVPDCWTKMTYAAALHELGHVMDREVWYRPQLEQERVASEWALQHCLPSYVSYVKRTLRAAYQSYVNCTPKQTPGYYLRLHAQTLLSQGTRGTRSTGHWEPRTGYDIGILSHSIEEYHERGWGSIG